MSVRVRLDGCEVAVVCLPLSVWDVWLDSERQSDRRRFPSTDRRVEAESPPRNPAASPPTRRCQLPPDELCKWNVSLAQFKRKHWFLKHFKLFLWLEQLRFFGGGITLYLISRVIKAPNNLGDVVTLLVAWIFFKAFDWHVVTPNVVTLPTLIVWIKLYSFNDNQHYIWPTKKDRSVQ